MQKEMLCCPSWLPLLDHRPPPPPPPRPTRTLLTPLRRFRDTKGGDFGLVHPAPLMKGLFSEEAACEDLASVLNMVPERGSLCVWTQDSHAAGKSVLLPYAAVSDVDMDVSVAVFSGGDSGGGGVCIGGGDAGGGVSPGVSLGAALEVQLQPPRHRRWRCCLPAACLLPANPV